MEYGVWMVRLWTFQSKFVGAEIVVRLKAHWSRVLPNGDIYVARIIFWIVERTPL